MGKLIAKVDAPETEFGLKKTLFRGNCKVCDKSFWCLLGKPSR